MRPSQDTDVRVMGFVHGVAMVQIWPRMTDLEMLRRQGRIWGWDRVGQWQRWCDIGMLGYLWFLVAVMAGVVFVVITTDQEWWSVLIPILHFMPIVADRVRAAKGWL